MNWSEQSYIPNLDGAPTNASPISLTQKKSETPREPGPLKGIRVLDFSRILAAPFCSQILADYGADVIKIEQPGQGDETRSWQGKGEAKIWKTDSPMSLYFAAINRNKRSLTLDLKRDEAKQIVYKLAKTSDVVLENFVPGKADELGVGYDKLSSINPRIVYASVSGYGPSGPYAHRPGYDAIAAAEGGLMHVTGHPDGGPVRPGLGMTDMATGSYAHGAIMAALFARERSGRGQHISASLFETQISLLINIGANWLNRGIEGQRFGAAHPSIVPYNTWRCKDGMYLALAANNQNQYRTLCDKIGMAELVDDERFATNALRVENRKAMEAVLDRVFAAKTVREWLYVLDGSGLAHGPVNTIEQAMAHPQTEARKMIQRVQWDALESGEVNLIGPPVKFSGSGTSVRQAPPLLGQHTNAILEEIGYSTSEVQSLKREKII
ncbi:hypothetical protein MBLNU459_g1782t1 [Dothideomycetes sp. NU459]